MTDTNWGGAAGSWISWVLSLSRPIKRLLAIAFDAAMVPIALWLAFALRFDSIGEGLTRDPALYALAALASVSAFAAFGLYRSVVRFISVRTLAGILGGVLISAATLLTAGRLLADDGSVPVSVVAIHALIALVWIGGSRFVARLVLTRPGVDRIPVVIYGAGDAGMQLVAALGSGHRYLPVATVDEKALLHGTLVRGVPVVAPSALPAILARHSVRNVLLAIPSASRRRRAEVIEMLEGLGVAIQTVPDLDEIISGHARVEDIREVDVSDLLGRDQIPPRPDLLSACITGKCVLVTGAGGSIGSELCRQILRLRVRRLVLLEVSELALYTVEQGLRDICSSENIDVEIVGLLGNAHHRPRVRDLLAAYGVQTIYHAAAYKHVPIVERNIIEGVHNNVFSTLHTAEAAVECGVETFVLISTDKAVNPTNVMGATKRIAEIVLQGLHARGGRTRFCMVRFGNVLESSGSVVPLFRQQIRRGGPVTVTHPDVIRYFMTIPEAAQLVLQAGSMGKGGDVFVLDMGKPVRIADLARRMIHLSGLAVREESNPGGDIEIVYTGLRPAEKLYEELLIGKNVSGTEHPMILSALEHFLPWPEVQALLTELHEALQRADCPTIRSLLTRAVREYVPTPQIDDLVWVRQQQVQAAIVAGDRRVTELGVRRQRPPN